MNEKTKAIFRSTGKKLIPFLIRHRFGVLLVGVVFYFLFWPNRVPHISTENDKPKTAASAAAAPLNKAKTASIAEVSLYDSAKEGADPKWALPAKLQSGELQAFARQVDKLENDIKAIGELEQKRGAFLDSLLSDKVKNTLWPAIKGNGFKDKNLPLDWYELVKDYYGDINVSAAAAEFLANNFAKIAIDMRLSSIHVRVIGGNVLAGDVLFVRALQSYIDQRQAYLVKVVPQLENVMQRLQTEFSVDFTKPPSPNY